MKRIVEGHQKFQKSVFPKKRETFERLAKGQNPRALWITCADSRMEPSLITQSEPGDLFICRAVGNIIPTYGHEAEGVSSTIEYAVMGLKVDHIIVCGHSDCGAMRGLLQPGSLEGLPCTSRWLRYADAARLHVEESGSGLSPEERLSTLIEENVLTQLEHLKTHPSVSSKLKGGKIQLHAWVFNIGAGELSAYDPEAQQFRRLSDVYHLNDVPAPAFITMASVRRAQLAS